MQKNVNPISLKSNLPLCVCCFLAGIQAIHVLDEHDRCLLPKSGLLLHSLLCEYSSCPVCFLFIATFFTSTHHSLHCVLFFSLNPFPALVSGLCWLWRGSVYMGDSHHHHCLVHHIGAPGHWNQNLGKKKRKKTNLSVCKKSFKDLSAVDLLKIQISILFILLEIRNRLITHVALKVHIQKAVMWKLTKSFHKKYFKATSLPKYVTWRIYVCVLWEETFPLAEGHSQAAPDHGCSRATAARVNSGYLRWLQAVLIFCGSYEATINYGLVCQRSLLRRQSSRDASLSAVD